MSVDTASGHANASAIKNLVDAQAALSRKLVFGDRQQVAAALFVDQLEELKRLSKSEKWKICDGCDGHGMSPNCDCGEDGCEYCEMLEACGLCNEVGLLDIDSEPVDINEEIQAEVVYELISFIKEKGKDAQ